MCPHLPHLIVRFHHHIYSVYVCIQGSSHTQIDEYSVNDATCLFFLNSFVIRVKWYKTTLPTRMMCFIILSRYKCLAFLCLTVLLSHKIRLKLWLHMFCIRLPTFAGIYMCVDRIMFLSTCDFICIPNDIFFFLTSCWDRSDFLTWNNKKKTLLYLPSSKCQC